MSVLNLSKSQKEKYEDFARNHTCKYRTAHGFRYTGAIGGADTFHITGTGLGEIVEVECICGEKLDLTDDF